MIVLMMRVPLLFTVADKFTYLAFKSAYLHSFGQAHSFNIEFPFHGLLIHCRFWILGFLNYTIVLVTFRFVMVSVLFFVTLSRNSASTWLSFIVKGFGGGMGCGRYSLESLLAGSSLTAIVE